jgi:hypothetical protein
MFEDKELWLAAISNPMFKLVWLENDTEVRKATALLKSEFQRNKDRVDEDSDR